MDDFVKGVDIIFIIGGEVGIGVVVGTEDDTVAETDTGVVVGIGFIVLVLSHPIMIRMQKIKKIFVFLIIIMVLKDSFYNVCIIKTISQSGHGVNVGCG